MRSWRVLATYWWSCFLCVLLMVISVSTSASEIADRNALTVKAVMLIKLSLFVRWPPSVATTKNICIQKKDQDILFNTVLFDVIKSKEKLSKLVNIQFINLTEENKLTKLNRCNLFFVNRDRITPSSAANLNRHYPEVLFVTDGVEYLKKGFHIGLAFESEKFVLYGNMDNIKSSNLKLKSSLMRLLKRY